jgi:hypothetical protein
MGSGPIGERATSVTSQKGPFRSWVGQADTTGHSRDDERESCSLSVCILSAGHMQASHPQGKYPCTGEAVIMMCADTKKDVHPVKEIHYNKRTMSLRLVEGG